MAMHSFFEVRIRYEKMMENGQNKKVNEPYLVDALSFTEAEARITKEMTPFISGDFKVKAVKERTSQKSSLPRKKTPMLTLSKD